jgi:N-acetyl-alpha-D-muramate 1-phosphate uridylyltransferase
MNTALLFSAGRGLRLRPLTDTTPKPLCTINHIALIDYHLKKLNACGITRVLINHAYLGDQIKRHLKNHAFNNLEIIFLPEPPGGLQTGGTLVQAKPHLGNSPFVAINADIFTDYDFSKLHCPDNSLAHLVLIKKPATHAVSDFALTTHKKLSNTKADCTFSGIACYHPDFLKQQPKGRHSLIHWLREAADKTLATGELYSGLWFDTGSPERLKKAREAQSN